MMKNMNDAINLEAHKKKKLASIDAMAVNETPPDAKCSKI